MTPMTLIIQPRNLRTLSWKNFQRVRRPKEAGADASTAHKISCSGTIVTLTLDTANTWVIQGRTSDALLKHEQGHWDIYVMKAEEINRAIQGSPGNTFKAKFEEISQKYDGIDRQYDEETDHSRNENKQEEWNCKIASAKRNHNLDLSVVCDQ